MAYRVHFTDGDGVVYYVVVDEAELTKLLFSKISENIVEIEKI